jgi:hypothetical protein
MPSRDFAGRIKERSDGYAALYPSYPVVGQEHEQRPGLVGWVKARSEVPVGVAINDGYAALYPSYPVGQEPEQRPGFVGWVKERSDVPVMIVMGKASFSKAVLKKLFTRQ